MKFLLLSAFFLLSASGVDAQQGRCIITSSDSTAFALTVNGISWGDSAEWSWDFVGEVGTYRITAFPNDSLASFLQTEVIVSAGVERTYDLHFLAEGQYQLNVAAETNYGGGATSASLPSMVEASSGQRSAQSMISSSAFDQAMTEIRAAFFQKDRQAIIESFLLDHSLSVDQLRQLLSAIDAEDLRLQLALDAQGKLHQPARLIELDDLFYLSSSKTRLRQAAK